MKKLVIAVGSLTLTALLGYLAFLLGGVGFDVRRTDLHEGRLRRLLAQKPQLDQVVQGLEDEGSHLLASPAGPAELRRVAAERGGMRAAEVLQKGGRWPQTRVLLAADMVYFIYFDAESVMRDFTCVSK